jgi:FkbM family methyltransferase
MAEDTIFQAVYGKFAISPATDSRSYERFKHNIYPQSKDIEFLKHFISPESIVVDIGARIGTMTIPFAKSAKQVYSFEPTPITRSYLEKNIALNDLKNVTVFPYALGSKDAESFMHVTSGIDSGQNTVSSTGEIAVPIRRLDDYVKEANLVKIDVEGNECAALEGGTNLIRTYHPMIFSEINFGQLWAHDGSPQKLEKFLRCEGYSLYLPLGGTRIGIIKSLPFITGLFFPGFFIRKPRNIPLDILAALPKDIPSDIQVLSGFRTILWTLQHKTMLCVLEHIQNILRRLFGIHFD